MKDIKTLVNDETRHKMAQDQKLGAGNFLAYALANNPAPKAPILFLEKRLETFSGERFTKLSLHDLDHLSRLYASLYKKMQVKAQDPVMVYIDDGIEYLIHYLALVRLGAIAVLTNGNMPPATALAHAKNVGAKGIFTDPARREQLFSGKDNREFSFVLTEDSIAVSPLDLSDVPHYKHVDDDPIMIAHSSGTTGIPKAVLLQQQAYFYGVRYRLGLPRIKGGETILSSLPHSHNCAISYQMLALLSGTPVYISSDHSGAAVLKRIEEFRPKMVVSFPQTYVEMTECNLGSYDLRSVTLWFNGGDAAHENHIRRLIQHGTHEQDGKAVPGSIFIDGMGSSEMGFSLFRNVHTPQTNNYNRCVGKPLEWVDAQILSEEGECLAPHIIGRLGVKAPSVTSGYWNNSLLTFRSRLAGYFLTGDLAYKDEEGRFFHVDRVPDLIRTKQGPAYGLQIEEYLLSRFPAIADCAVFGRTLTESDFQVPSIRVRLRAGTDLNAMEEKEVLQIFNRALVEKSLPVICELEFSSLSQVPLGTTGKVLKRELRQIGVAQ